MLYSIEKITTLIGARRYGSADGNIRWILTDSRSVCFPEETLFFAIRSERNDGHKYIADLYRRGVRNFVVDELPEGYSEAYADANFLKVPHPVEALQRLAERHRDEFDMALPTALPLDGCHTQPAQLQLADRRAAVGLAAR